MKRLAQTIVAVCAVLSAATALADTKEFGDAKVSIDFPKGWAVSQAGNLTQAVEPKNEALMAAFVTEPAKLEADLNTLGTALGKAVTDMKWDDKFTPVPDINGLKAQAKKGTGKVGGKEAQLGLVVVATPNNKALVLVGVLDASKKEAHKAEMNGTMMSPKPMK